MSYKFERDKLKIPTAPGLDRRVRLTEAQREQIRLNVEQLSNRALAEKFGVSRRLVQFIRNPEKREDNVAIRRERIAEGRSNYYDKEQHRDSIQRHRRHKQSLFIEGKLTE